MATWLTRPEQTDKLVGFYKMARPGGPGWKPIAKKCPNVEVDQDLGLSIVAALFAAGLVYSVLPLTGFLIFGDYSAAAYCIVVALFCAIVVAILGKKIAWGRDA